MDVCIYKISLIHFIFLNVHAKYLCVCVAIMPENNFRFLYEVQKKKPYKFTLSVRPSVCLSVASFNSETTIARRMKFHTRIKNVNIRPKPKFRKNRISGF